MNMRFATDFPIPSPIFMGGGGGESLNPGFYQELLLKIYTSKNENLIVKNVLFFIWLIWVLLKAKANPIIVTAGSADKLDFCKKLGATAVINYKEFSSFAPKVLEATNNKGV